MVPNNYKFTPESYVFETHCQIAGDILQNEQKPVI